MTFYFPVKWINKPQICSHLAEEKSKMRNRGKRGGRRVGCIVCGRLNVQSYWCSLWCVMLDAFAWVTLARIHPQLFLCLVISQAQDDAVAAPSSRAVMFPPWNIWLVLVLPCSHCDHWWRRVGCSYTCSVYIFICAHFSWDVCSLLVGDRAKVESASISQSAHPLIWMSPASLCCCWLVACCRLCVTLFCVVSVCFLSFVFSVSVWPLFLLRGSANLFFFFFLPPPHLCVFLASPSGKKFRSKPQLARYLGNQMDLSSFDFRTGKMLMSKLNKNRQRLRYDNNSQNKVTQLASWKSAAWPQC